MITIIVRRGNIDDLDILTDFQIKMAWETENKKLVKTTIQDGIRQGLKDPERALYLIAEINNIAVGSLMITPEWSDWRNGWFWWIQSVYTKPDYRRKGVFKKLYQFVKNEALSNPNIRGIRLYVEKHNHNAQQVYQRLGMKDSGYLLLEEEFIKE